MQRLPLELLHLIFSLLLQRDKLECMSVCRQWKNVIQDGNLFRAICIHRQQQLDQLIKIVKKDPDIGKKVEQLNMQMLLYTYYDEIELVNLFPNLREFTIIDSISYSRTFEIKPQQNHPWCASIKKIVEFGSKTFTRVLLSSGLCKSLTFIFLTRQDYERAYDFIKLLGNAPALDTLYMNRFLITIEDLERLHEVVPLLKSLLLKKMHFAVIRVPANITPATSVKSFSCLSSHYHDPLKINPLLPYISHKYTGLEELSFKFDRVTSFHANQEENIMDLMAQQRETFKSYINRLKPGLKALSLNLGDFRRGDVAFDFGILDECGCQVTKLNLGKRLDITLLKQLANSTQVQYIQSLTVNETDVNADGQIVMEWLKHFKILRELMLHFSFSENESKPPSLNLTKLLESLNSDQLENLELYNAHLEVGNSRESHLKSSIKHLTFSKVTFQEGIDIIISRSFPSLKCLTLDSCFQKRGSFTLPNTTLSYLKISYVFVKECAYILVTTLANNQYRLYTTYDRPITVNPDTDNEEKNIITFPSISSQPYNALTSILFITIVCKSVYSFSMSNSNFHNTCY